MRFEEREDVPWAKARGTRKKSRRENYSKINRSIQSRKQIRKNKRRYEETVFEESIFSEKDERFMEKVSFESNEPFKETTFYEESNLHKEKRGGRGDRTYKGNRRRKENNILKKRNAFVENGFSLGSIAYENNMLSDENDIEQINFSTAKQDVVVNRYGWEDNQEANTFSQKYTDKFSRSEPYRFKTSGKEYTSHVVFNNKKRQMAKGHINKVIDKTGVVPGKAVRIAREVAQKARQELTKALEDKQKEKDEYKSVGESIGIGFPLVLVGGVVSVLGFFVTIIPVLILSFLISTNVEDQIVTAAEQEYYVWDENVGGQKYKSWYGLDGNWCAMFVSYCAERCGYINDGIMPRTASVAQMAGWYLEREEFHYASEGYEPKPGDIIFFQEGMSHVGIVIQYDPEQKWIYTIEGNTGVSETEIYHEGSQVQLQIYPLTYPRITGYGTPDYPIDLNMDREIVMYYENKNERRVCA